MDNTLKSEISEAILRYAVNENHKREMAAIPPNDELAKIYTFTKRHEDRMKMLFAKESRRDIRVKIFNVSKRIALIFIIVSSVLFGMLLTNQQIRAEIRQIIIEWYEQFTRFSFSGGTISEGEIEWHPSYLPDGFEETDVLFIGNMVIIEYENQEDELITIEYSLSDGLSIAVDNEHSDYEVVMRDGLEYHVFQSLSNEYRTKIIWTYSGYSFILRSNIDSDELMKMAMSLTMKK